MSYEDLVRARAARATKESAKEARRAAKEAKKATKDAEANKPAYCAKPKEPPSGEKSRGRKRKSTAPASYALEPKVARVTQAVENEQETSAPGLATWICPGQVEWHDIVRMRSPQRAPMAPT